MNWPKMPNRKSFLEKGYTPVQMREYAEKCVKQAIAEAEKQEPACCNGKCPNKKECENAMQCLYTYPQPAQPKREPLTLDAIDKLISQNSIEGYPQARSIVRATEVAHGIKGEVC